MAWRNSCLARARQSMSRQAYVGKKLVEKDFFAYCGKKGLLGITELTSVRAYKFLSSIRDERGANAANRYRKNLLAA